MSGRIDIRSTSALPELKAALEQFSSRVKELSGEVDEFATVLLQRYRTLENAAREEIQQARRRLSNAPEERRHDAEAALADAETHLQSVRHMSDRIGQVVFRLRRRAAEANEAAGRRGARGTDYLDRKMSEVRNYYSVSLPAGPTSSSGAEGAVAHGSETAVSKSSPTRDELERSVLPRGWKWVGLDEINVTPVDGASLSFEGDSRLQLIDRFERLRRDVLPELDLNWGFVAERLRRDDMRAGVYDSSGKLGAFETFFSPGSSIHLQRSTASELYSIDDGRHRIEMAHQLGWPAVPAQTHDGEESKNGNGGKDSPGSKDGIEAAS